MQATINCNGRYNKGWLVQIAVAMLPWCAIRAEPNENVLEVL